MSETHSEAMKSTIPQAFSELQKRLKKHGWELTFSGPNSTMAQATLLEPFPIPQSAFVLALLHMNTGIGNSLPLWIPSQLLKVAHAGSYTPPGEIWVLGMLIESSGRQAPFIMKADSELRSLLSSL